MSSNIANAKQLLNTERNHLYIVENIAFIDVLDGTDPAVRFKLNSGMAPGYILENYDTIAEAFAAKAAIQTALAKGDLLTDLYTGVELNSVSPGTASTGGGATIVLSGVNLSKNSSVKINGVACTIGSINKSLTQLTVTTPALSAGTYDLTYDSYATATLTLVGAMVIS